MKIRIIRATIAQKRQVYPGEELEVGKNEAVQIIGAGKAIALKDAPETTEAEMGKVETTKLRSGKPTGKKKVEA